jgi:hypothetical protein
MKRVPLLIILFSSLVFSQPYTDLVSFNYQQFSARYKENNSLQNQTENYNFNVLIPIEYKNGNAFLFRLNSEMLNSSVTNIDSLASKLTSVAIPVGFQLVSKNKKWKTIVLAIPKVASSFENTISNKDFQYGGYFSQSFSPNEKLKIKMGLYYNKERFGNFFIPLLGLDWQATNRLSFYGMLPTNYKAEYNLIKNRLYTGLNFKAVTRSFNLGNTNQYVRFDESLLKLFMEGFVLKNVLVSAEVGYSLGKNPLEYDATTDNINVLNPVYSDMKNYSVLNFGIVYRIRKEFLQQ